MLSSRLKKRISKNVADKTFKLKSNIKKIDTIGLPIV